MYGLDLSADIQTSIKRTPRKYASLRSHTDRFAYQNKDITLNLPFYDTAKFTSISSRIKNSKKKMSNLQSKVERFPEHGFMVKYFDKTILDRQNTIYNTDVFRHQSMITQCINSPRTYGLKSNTKRFHRRNIDVPYGAIDDPGRLGPGSYKNAEEVNTSSGRYLSTVGSVLMSPRNYSSFKSKTPRFRGRGVRISSGGGRMWPPMISRR
jgi:hypothetical protein